MQKNKIALLLTAASFNYIITTGMLGASNPQGMDQEMDQEEEESVNERSSMRTCAISSVETNRNSSENETKANVRSPQTIPPAHARIPSISILRTISSNVSSAENEDNYIDFTFMPKKIERTVSSTITSSKTPPKTLDLRAISNKEKQIAKIEVEFRCTQ